MLDGVFNHVGRDFFAFKDVQQNRENSRYASWFENVNFLTTARITTVSAMRAGQVTTTL